MSVEKTIPPDLYENANDRFHTIKTETITSATSNVISIHAILGNNNRFQKKHIRVCEMLRHFFMLWKLNLATNAHDNLDKWTQLIQTDQITEWRIFLNKWRQPEFPDALRAIISVVWTQAHWTKLWIHTRTEWNHLIKFYDKMINDENENEKTEEEN